MRFITSVVAGLVLVASAQVSMAAIEVASADPLLGNSWAPVFSFGGDEYFKVRLEITDGSPRFESPIGTTAFEFVHFEGATPVGESADTYGTYSFGSDTMSTSLSWVEVTGISHPASPGYFAVWFPSTPQDMLEVTVLFQGWLTNQSEDPDVSQPMTWKYVSTNQYLNWDTGGDTSGAAPEPASMVVWALLGACGVGLGWWRRNRAA